MNYCHSYVLPITHSPLEVTGQNRVEVVLVCEMYSSYNENLRPASTYSTTFQMLNEHCGVRFIIIL